MKRMYVIALLCSMLGYGQDCMHTNLSKVYDITASSVSAKDQPDEGVFRISIGIMKKSTGKQQQLITFTSGMMHFQPYADCNNVRSYSTGFHQHEEDIDNDYGDIIVADFNFDGKEDLAVKRDSGGNGGPFYNYYLQDKNGTFVIDTYLSETMIFFPTEIDAKNRTLMTLVHANAYQMSETTYKLNPKTGWKEIKQRFVQLPIALQASSYAAR